MTCRICATKILFIDKTYFIGDYEMTNVFNMLGHPMTNINYTAIQK